MILSGRPPTSLQITHWLEDDLGCSLFKSGKVTYENMGVQGVEEGEEIVESDIPLAWGGEEGWLRAPVKMFKGSSSEATRA